MLSGVCWPRTCRDRKGSLHLAQPGIVARPELGCRERLQLRIRLRRLKKLDGLRADHREPDLSFFELVIAFLERETMRPRRIGIDCYRFGLKDEVTAQVIEWVAVF